MNPAGAQQFLGCYVREPGSSPLTQLVKSRAFPKLPYPAHSGANKKSPEQCVLFPANLYTFLRIKTMSGIAVSKGLDYCLLATPYSLLPAPCLFPPAFRDGRTTRWNKSAVKALQKREKRP